MTTTLPATTAPEEVERVTVPPFAVIVLTTVTSQIRPRPGVVSTPLLHVVVGPIVPDPAFTVPADPSDPRRRKVAVSRIASERRMGVT